MQQYYDQFYYLRLQDTDTWFYHLVYFFMVLGFNGCHTYVMLTWSNNWAQGSIILLMFTLYHYTQSFFSILLVYNDDLYLYRWKDIRFMVMMNAYFTLITIIVGFWAELYFLFQLQTVVGFLSALYLAYGLIISSTLMPVSLSILIEEANLNILDRSPTYS